jgi:hypothetical protein
MAGEKTCEEKYSKKPLYPLRNAYQLHCPGYELGSPKVGPSACGYLAAHVLLTARLEMLCSVVVKRVTKDSNSAFKEPRLIVKPPNNYCSSPVSCRVTQNYLLYL